MKRIPHPIGPGAIGSDRHLMSLHYGEPGAGEKAYLQASLHADELPGMLVMHHLIRLLDSAEAAQRLRGEIVLVPVANPIGLAQGLLHQRLGRFEATSGENFNRGYPDYLEAITPAVVAQLGRKPDANRAAIRAAMRAHVRAIRPTNELTSLRKTLSSLACDADIVLDLHCDLEALLHLYVETPYWSQCEPLARLLGVETALLAKNSGGASFDEHLSSVWWQLDERLEHERGDTRPTIPLACMAVTIELRGQTDVSHELASRDARALFDFFVHRGLIAAGDEATIALPALRCEPTPLTASEDIVASTAGVIAFSKRPGDRIEPGDVIAEIVDPMVGRAVPVRAKYPGVLYARTWRRYANPGEAIARIAGKVPFRTGNLLSP
jgi:predicted deacylase